MNFFVGLHHPSDAHRFPQSMVSIQAIKHRKSVFLVNDWILDSGAFTQIVRDGGYRDSVSVYAEQVRRWKDNGNMLAAVAQDYMCEQFALDITGKTIPEHQSMTIARYDELLDLAANAPILPVLQGYRPSEYAQHVRDYGARLAPGAWVGVGSVCKRNASPHAIVAVLDAILAERSDLKLHGFGVKLTSLRDPRVRRLLHSADSMAWSFAARKQGRNANSWEEAAHFCEQIEQISDSPQQLFMEWEAA